MENKLSNDPTAIVLTILSLIIILGGCCCGILAAASLALSIIGLVMANKSLKEYALAPEEYSFKSYKTMNTAKILGIIGIVLSILVMTAYAAFWIIGGQEVTRDLWDAFEEGKTESEWKWEYNSNTDTDSILNDDTTITLKKQGDSIVIDTVAAETQ